MRGNTVATVAHPEVTPELLASWLDLYGYDIEGYDGEPMAPSVQSIEQIREDLPKRCVAMHAAFTDRIYESWLSRVAAYAQA